MRTLLHEFIFFVGLFLAVPCFAQETNLPLWGKADRFMQTQAKETFNLVDEALLQYPPTTNFCMPRKLALYNLDALIHDTHNDSCAFLLNFIQVRMKRIADDLDKPLAKGMKIYKLYNDGYIVRTPSVTIAFDMIRGSAERQLITDSIMQTLVSHCDIMFISHSHNDHADLGVAKFFAAQGKPVITPLGLWENENKNIQPTGGKTMLNKIFYLKNKLSLQVKIFPGHQDELLNNVYVVTTPERISVTHTGDQYNTEDRTWIKTVKEHAKTDVLLIECWAMHMDEMIDGFAPRLVITGHENELLFHTIDHREPYWLTYKKMSTIKYPYIIMTWGESYTFVPRKK